MDEIKEFKKVDLKIMQVLIGLRLNDIFKQLDMFIINFGDEIKYTLHTFSFLRIRKGAEIILTSSDEYLLPDHNQMPNKIYKKDEMHEKSLLKMTIEKTKEMLNKAIIKKVEVSDIADIIITFDNGVVIETFTDCLWQNNEFYRFFKYKDIEQPHYVIKYLNGIIILEEVYADVKTYEKIHSKEYLKLKEKIDKKNKIE